MGCRLGYTLSGIALTYSTDDNAWDATASTLGGAATKAGTNADSTYAGVALAF